ncbi:hypothetical protein DFH08DRAFT_799010 [Mycena albidolilacea]|uniref:Uncharacterized protein n=1 Tax=Mycena albidolilacea TaxID=1033008 RepID=A0AAD7F4A2_9AGAR|nr:hypothetical protein DFH08DRAFT_799010 [Mycena albidolilacea]
MQLGDHVNATLHTQDRLCLQEQSSGVLCMLDAIHQHFDVIPVSEHEIIEQSIQDIIQALDVVTVQSFNLPSAPAISVTYSEPTGRPGQPRIEINRNFLSFGLELRGPTGLASVAGVSSCTICRHALDYNFMEPAAPVYRETVDRTSGEVSLTSLKIDLLKENPCFAMMGLDHYTVDWQQGILVGCDYWACEDAFIAKRLSGEVERRNFF